MLLLRTVRLENCHSDNSDARKKSKTVTLSNAKGLSTYWENKILRCAQNDKMGRCRLFTSSSIMAWGHTAILQFAFYNLTFALSFSWLICCSYLQRQWCVCV